MGKEKTLLDLAELRRRREALGLTMQQAAERAGFEYAQQWHLIESDIRADVKSSTIGKLAKALACSPCDLLLKTKRSDKR